MLVISCRQNGNVEMYEEYERPKMENAARILRELNVPYKILSSKEVNEKFKPLKVKEGVLTLSEELGGTLMSSKCLEAFQVGLTLQLS